MRLVDVLSDLSLKGPWKVQIEHGSVRQIELFIELSSLFGQLLHVTSHVSNDNGIEDRAQGAKNEAREEFEWVSAGHDFTDSENVKASVQENEVLAPKGIVAFEEALVGLLLLNVHKVHILNPALLLEHNEEPDAGEDMHENK